MTFYSALSDWRLSILTLAFLISLDYGMGVLYLRVLGIGVLDISLLDRQVL